MFKTDLHKAGKNYFPSTDGSISVYFIHNISGKGIPFSFDEASRYSWTGSILLFITCGNRFPYRAYLDSNHAKNIKN